MRRSIDLWALYQDLPSLNRMGGIWRSLPFRLTHHGGAVERYARMIEGRLWAKMNKHKLGIGEQHDHTG